MADVYIDFENSSGLLTGSWSSTGTGVTEDATSGAALTELAVNDYVRISGSSARSWYRVIAITDDDTFLVDFAPDTTGLDEGFSGDTLANWDESANDGASTANAYCTHNAAAFHETMAAGDVWNYRGGQTEYLHANNVDLVETAGNASAGKSKLIADVDGDIWAETGKTNFYWQRARSRAWDANTNYVHVEGFTWNCYGSGDARHKWIGAGMLAGAYP